MRSPNDLMGVEPASPELISAISSKRDVVIAKPGGKGSAQKTRHNHENNLIKVRYRPRGISTFN